MLGAMLMALAMQAPAPAPKAKAAPPDHVLRVGRTAVVWSSFPDHRTPLGLVTTREGMRDSYARYGNRTIRESPETAGLGIVAVAQGTHVRVLELVESDKAEPVFKGGIARVLVLEGPEVGRELWTFSTSLRVTLKPFNAQRALRAQRARSGARRR